MVHPPLVWWFWCTLGSHHTWFFFLNVKPSINGPSIPWHTMAMLNNQMAVCQNLVPLVNIKIAGKWMFIPLKMVLIDIDPYPNGKTNGSSNSNWWDWLDAFNASSRTLASRSSTAARKICVASATCRGSCTAGGFASEHKMGIETQENWKVINPTKIVINYFSIFFWCSLL